MYDFTHEFAQTSTQAPDASAVAQAPALPPTTSPALSALPIEGLTQLREERLPFTVRIARDDDALRKAITMRQAAYGRHLPDLAASMGEPENNDLEASSRVLIAEARLDAAPLGTMRIQTNQYGRLPLEASVPLPLWSSQGTRAEATRLGVVAGPMGRLVKTALFKAFYQYCLLNGVDWMVITARPPLHRQYQALMFQEVFPGHGLIPMAHVGGIGHHVLALDVVAARARWQAAGHPLLDFMCQTLHPDLQLHDTLDSTTSEQVRHDVPMRDLSFASEAVGSEPSSYNVTI